MMKTNLFSTAISNSPSVAAKSLLKPVQKYIFLLAFLLSSVGVWGQLNITAGGAAVTQNFNAIVGSPGTLPSEWTIQTNSNVRTITNYVATGASTIGQVGGNNMATNANGGIYRFNANNVTTEAAVGGLSSSSSAQTVALYTRLKNNAANPITNFTISYNVEKYRNGSNAAGFSIELFYSTNGTSWTSCGPDFLSSFAADADNTGFATAPGVSVAISSKTFTPSAAIAQNGVVYFAWRYSVTSGTTTSNAQALGVDDISISANVPTITVSPTTLTGFIYAQGSGPSVSQSYSLSATNLSTATGNITVTGSTNYLVSKDNGTFSSSVTVPFSGFALSSTPIYTRLKAGLSVGSYNSETISNAGGGATTVNVTASGSVTAPAAITSAQSGSWSLNSTWVGGVVPTNAADAIIASGHVVEMDVITGGINDRNSGTTTTVNVGGTLATKVSYNNNGTTTINGTFQINNGGFGGGSKDFVYGTDGTLIFNHNTGLNYGDPGGIDGNHRYWPGTNSPKNVALYNNSPINLGVNRTIEGTFQTAAGVTLSGSTLTLNGIAQINANGFFNNAPIYGAASTLVYNIGAVYGRGIEWNAISGAGYPNAVQLINNTTLNYPNTGNFGADPFNQNLSIAKDLTIDAGSSFYMGYGDNGNKAGSLIIGRNLIINGNFGLGNAVGGDFYIAGNWTKGVGSNFYPNGRAVFFNGTAAQTITGATTFDYLTINNTAGVSLANSIINNLTLDFANGKLTLGTNDLTIGSGGTITNATSSKYVVTNLAGQLKRMVAGTSVSFPIGTIANYNPISATNTGSLDTYGFRVAQGVTGAADINSMVNNSWFASEGTAGGGNIKVIPQWNALDEGSTFSTGYNYIDLYSPALTSYAATVASRTATLNGTSSFNNTLTGAEYFAVAKRTPALTISGTLDESTLNTSTVALTLTNDTFADATLLPANFTLSGSQPGVTVFAIAYNSPTSATLTLAYDDTDFDDNFTNFKVTIDKSELAVSAINLVSNSLTITAATETLSATVTLPFGLVCNGSSSPELSFTITGTKLKAGNINLAALAGYSYSETSGGTFASILSFSQVGGVLSKLIYIKLTPIAANATYNGSIVISGGGAPNINKAVTGNSNVVNAAIVTNTVTTFAQTTATLRATSSTFSNCPATIEKGFVYAINSVNPSPINGGTGVTKSAIGTLGSSGNFSQAITGLTEGTTYTYQAYLFDGITYTYGGYQSFTTTFTGTLNNVTLTKACLGDDSGTITWTAPATSATPTGYMLFAVTGATTPSGTLTTALTDYANANANYAAGTNSSVPAGLGKLLYKGNTTSVDITGLTENTNYSFLVLSYEDGGSVRRFSNGAAGGRDLDVKAQDDVKTFTAIPSNNQVTLNWTNYLPTSCFDEVLIVANQGSVVFTPTGDGSSYTANDVYNTSNQVVYKGSATSKAITGFTNGLEYCFKIFVRKGTVWSDGITVCSTPDVVYCASNGNTTFQTGVTYVNFKEIDNATPTKTQGYTYFSSPKANVYRGESVPLTVRVNTAGNFTVYTKAWIDWNHNGSFNDSGEEYDLGSTTNKSDGITSLSPLDITVPTSAYLGDVRMRVSSKYSSAATSCLTGFDGEVEDYTITITQATNAEINVRGGATQISIPNGFDAPYGLNNTLFASTNLNTDSIEKEFTIENIGLANLLLTGSPIIQLEGANPTEFIVTQQATTPVVNGTNVTFKVKFRPTFAGLRTANVRIESNDSDENPYLFAIEGTGNCTTAPTINVFPTSGPSKTLVTFSSSTSDLTGATVTYNNITVPITYQTADTIEVLVPDEANDGNFIIQLATGCSKTQSFDVFDTDITACETSGGGGSTASDLIIYEVYDESGGSGGVITIYNRTGSTVNFNGYSIQRAGDYGGTYLTTANLTGTIAANAVAVIAVTGSPCGFPTTGNGSFGAGFNANDGFRLMKGTTLIDDVRAPNYLGYYLKRKNTNLNPNITFTASEWTTQSLNSGECLSGIGTAPIVKLPPKTTNPTFVINCGKTGTTLTIAGTEGVSGGLGLTYQWYFLGTSGNWTAVTNGGVYSGATSAALAISDIAGLDDYQYYCQVRENTATCYAASNSTLIRIAEKTWNGSNWLGRGNITTVAPTVIDKIKLNANYNTLSNGNLNGCSLVNNNTYQLTISANTYANIEGNITNNGTMLIESDGNLVQKNDAATFMGGDITAKRDIPLSIGRQQYNYLVSPLLDYSLKDIYKDGSGNPVTVPTIFYHSEATNRFYASSGNYIKGRGLAVKEPTAISFATGPMNATFLGKPTNGAFNYTIVNSNILDIEDRGFNLIGNPYPSNIDLITFYTLNGGSGGTLDATFYFWDNKANSQTSQAGNGYGGQAYATFNALTPPIGGTGLPATGDPGFTGAKTPTQYVKTGQGFMVRSTVESTSLIFNNTIRTTENGATKFFGKTTGKTETSVNRYWLKMISPTNIASNIAVVYFSEGNNAFTKDDSRSLGGSDVVYSIVENEKVSINGRSNFVDTDIISLGSKYFVSGNYTIGLGNKEGIFDQGQNLYLKDKQTNIITNLNEGNYSFQAIAGESTGRFEIIYKPEAVLATGFSTKEQLQVYRDNQDFIVQSSSKIIDEVEVFDISGRLLQKVKANSTKVLIDGNALVSGVYLLKIKRNKEIISKKIIK